MTDVTSSSKACWPKELKEKQRQAERAYYYRECLRNYIKQVSPSEFDTAMDRLEAAQQDFLDKMADFQNAERAWDRQNPTFPTP